MKTMLVTFQMRFPVLSFPETAVAETAEYGWYMTYEPLCDR